jgi:hypothetical protein
VNFCGFNTAFMLSLLCGQRALLQR